MEPTGCANARPTAQSGISAPLRDRPGLRFAPPGLRFWHDHSSSRTCELRERDPGPIRRSLSFWLLVRDLSSPLPPVAMGPCFRRDDGGFLQLPPQSATTLSLVHPAHAPLANAILTTSMSVSVGRPASLPSRWIL